MSQKAYITQYNARRIIKQCHLMQLDDIDEQIWKERLDVFNKLETNELLAFIALMKDSAHFIDEVWIPFEKAKDDYTWMTPPKLPAFHYEMDCSALHSAYHNFKVPKSIQEKGPEEVQKFRNWFNKIGGERLLIENPKAFEDFLKQAWGQLVVAEFFQEHRNSEDASNSGQAKFGSMSVEELEQWIEEHLDAADKYWMSSNTVSEILSRMIKSSFSGEKTSFFKNRTRFPNDEVIDTLETVHREYKIPLMNALFAYYTKSFNPDLSIEVRVLRQLKFRSCNQCSSNNELLL